MRKKIKGYERYSVDADGYIVNDKTGRILHGTKAANGYIHVELGNEQGRKIFLMHRIVAEAFVPNPDGLPIINHKDERPDNNSADNLEWCSYAYNVNYGNAPRKRRESLAPFHASERIKEQARENGKRACRSVIQYDKAGNVVSRYGSIKEAHERTGANASHIIECCKGGRHKTAGGYVWKYERSDDLSVCQF